MAQHMPQPMKHPKTGVYYFRKVVPAHLRGALGRGEFRISLGTKDLGEAKRLYPATAAKVDALIAQAGGGPVILDHQQVVALAGLWYQRELEATEANPEDPESYAIYLDHLQDADERGKGREAVSGDVDAILAAEGLLAITQASREQLADRIFWHRVRLYNTLTRRAGGDYRPDPEVSKFPAWVPPTTATGASAALAKPPISGLTFTDLFTAWQTERQPPADTVSAWGRIMALLVKHVGHNDASRLTKGNVVAWKDALLAEGKAPATVTKHLLAINAVLNAAVKNDRLSVNPARGVSVSAKGKGPRGRFPYSDADAATILNAARQLKGARRWVPWLLAYTGARREEVCQALVKDIRKAGDVWYLDINKDDPGKALKTAASARKVPLHPLLVSEGFLEYVASVPKGSRASGAGLLFPELTVNGFGKKGAHWGAWYSIWTRQTLGITDKRLVAHSWRHRFEDACREARIEQESYAGFWVTRRSGGIVCRRFDNLDAVLECDTIDKLGQLVRAFQPPPSFRCGDDQLEHHQPGGF